MTKREHEIEYLFTVRGLELFILNIQDKITGVHNSRFERDLPQPPSISGRTDAGAKPQEPKIDSRKDTFSFSAFWEDIVWFSEEAYMNVMNIIGILALTALWWKSLSDPIVFQWGNIIMLLISAIIAIGSGIYLFQCAIDEWKAIKALATIITAMLAWFGITTPFIVALPLYYAIGVATGFVSAAKANNGEKKMNQEALNYYRKQLAIWEKNQAEVLHNSSEYQRQLAEYEDDRQRWNSDVTAWHADKERRVSEYQRVIEEATVKLNALYAAEKIIPLPYRYADAICYLYDFLSTSPDEYDIRFALERADQAEIKRLMGTIIQNQSQQILLTTIQTMELERLHDDNVGIRSAIYESGERMVASVQDMGRSVSAGISELRQTVSDGLSATNAAIQDGNQRDTALLRDIAENSAAVAGASAYLAARQNTGMFPAQWEAQEFLVHSKKYL